MTSSIAGVGVAHHPWESPAGGLMELHDKVALVTGAARRVGREIALTLGRAGCHVAIHYRRSAVEAAELADEIRGMGRRAVALSADLATLESIPGLIKSVQEQIGGPDILINNASVFAPTDWGRSGPDEWNRHFHVNAVAPFLLAQACRPIFHARGGGAVINLSDIHGARPIPTHAAYSASKAALDSITRSLALLMAPKVTVNAVAPGVALFPEDYSENLRRSITQRIPLGRPGSPHDVAQAVLYLLRHGPHITGQVLVVDGGRSIAW